MNQLVLPIITRRPLRATPPPKIVVYSDLEHALTMKSQTQKTEEALTQASISTILSEIVSMVGWAGLNVEYTIPTASPSEGTYSIAANQVNKAHYYAMASLMHCVKEITAENAEYPTARWSALRAASESEEINLTDITVDKQALLDIVSKTRPYINPKGVVTKLIEGDENYTHMFTQIKLIYSFSGMKMMVEMFEFCTKPTTCAILLTPVMNQSLKYKEVYNRILQENQQTFEYGRILIPSKLEELDASKYADLYLATFHSIKRNLTKNFKTSSHPSIVPVSIIKRFSKIHLADYGKLSEADKELLEKLGVDVASALARAESLTKKLKKPDTDNSDSSDDDEPVRKRKRN